MRSNSSFTFCMNRLYVGDFDSSSLEVFAISCAFLSAMRLDFRWLTMRNQASRVTQINQYIHKCSSLSTENYLHSALSFSGFFRFNAFSAVVRGFSRNIFLFCREISDRG